MLSPTIGWFTDTLWLTLFLGLVLIPLLEWIWHDRTRSTGPQWVWPKRFLQLTGISVLTQAMGLCIVSGKMAPIDVLTIALSSGYVAGGTGIVLAHEDAHRAIAKTQPYSLITPR